MSEEEQLLNDLSAQDKLLRITKTISEEEIPEIEERKFFLDRLVLEKKHIFGYLIPVLLVLVLFALGLFLGIYTTPWSSGTSAAAQAAYTFWVTFILICTYLLNWLVWAINNVVQEANEMLDISEEKHKRILNLMFGWLGIIMSFLIALPFILYDITGFGTEEGWLNDVYLSGEEWYPGSESNPYGLGSIIWLIVWGIPWLYFGSFVWLSSTFLVYMNILKKANWRLGIQRVVREKQYKRLLTLSIATFAPFAPYLAIKLIFQIFYLPWWSDTIGTYLLFGIFIIGVVGAPIIVSKDVKSEKIEVLRKLQDIGSNYFDTAVRKIYAGEQVDNETLLKATILQLNYKETVAILEKKVLDKYLTRKILIALIAPVLSILIKFVIGGSLAF
ncbi:MAG: membrane protein of unknown function [Promethearchaeota archaeon]|nr:MAG: membrane protein of unknown function [Candidatus Lokiarchaeota archaeon]